MSILIVDDSRVMRQIQRKIVAGLFDVPIHEARDGLDALETMRNCEFDIDLVLTDWNMPRMDGLALARVLKGHDQLKKIPVLMVTGNSEEHKMREALQAGIDGYIMKPFTSEILLKALQPLLQDEELVLNLDELHDVALPSSTLLAGLSEEICDLLFEESRIIEVEKGSILLREGTPVDAFHILLSGRVEQKSLTSGDIDSVEYLAGDCFAALELMAGDGAYVDYVAADRCSFGSIAGPIFEKMMRESGELSLNLSRHVAGRVRAIRGSLESTSGVAGLSGSFDVLELLDLIQALNLRQSSGILELPDVGAAIQFSAGEVVAASCDGMFGKAAFRQIIEREPQGFRFCRGKAGGERNISGPTTKLLLDTMQAIDEGVAV